MKNYCKPVGQVSGTCCCGLNTLSRLIDITLIAHQY